jgi:hypothetical protein
MSTVAERDKKKYRLSEKHASQSKPASCGMFFGILLIEYLAFPLIQGFDYAQPPGAFGKIKNMPGG